MGALSLAKCKLPKSTFAFHKLSSVAGKSTSVDSEGKLVIFGNNTSSSAGFDAFVV